MSTNLNLNSNIAKRQELRVPFKTDLNTWHKGVDSITFNESINNLPARFLPRDASLNGTDDAIAHQGYDVSGGISMMVKFKIPTTAQQEVISNKRTLFRANADRSLSWFSDVDLGLKTSTLKLIDVDWNTVVITQTGTSGAFYVNNVKETFSGADVLDNSATQGYFGRFGTSYGEIMFSEICIIEGTITDQQASDFYNGIISVNCDGYFTPKGMGDYEYDLSGKNKHAGWIGTGTHFDYDVEGSTYPNDNGYSLWQLAANPDIQVPFDINGLPLSLTPGVNIPAGYTHSYDVLPGGDKWNVADSLEGYNETAAADTELEIFDRLNATRQTVTSRASIYYDATSLATRSRYHVTEATDPVIYDTYFEAAYKDLFFGRLLLDGSNNIIRHDEQVVYDTTRTVTQLPSVLTYCRIKPIYPA